MKGDRAELERLVGEARREAVPDVDWDAIETSLMARVKAEPRLVRARRRPSPGPFVLAFALAAVAGAAVAAVGIVRREGPAKTPVVAETPTPKETKTRKVGPKNGNALAIGDVVESASEPVIVDHQGQATWTLEPESAAHVEELGGVIRVALDRGVLSAKVVKSTAPESFVVRVEGTRVAVHGTAFRVTRMAHAVRVDVTEGVVGVGPLHGPSFDVAAPGSTTTTFDGVRTDLRHAARAAAKSSERSRTDNSPALTAEQPSLEDQTTTEQRPSEQAPPPPEAAPATSAAPAPTVAPRAGLESGPTPSIDGVVDAVRRCFRDGTVTSGDLHVTVNTQMALRIQASGRVGEAVFTPPLAPNVRRCVDDSVGAMRFPASPNGFAIDRVLDLER